MEIEEQQKTIDIQKNPVFLLLSQLLHDLYGRKVKDWPVIGQEANKDMVGKVKEKLRTLLKSKIMMKIMGNFPEEIFGEKKEFYGIQRMISF